MPSGDAEHLLRVRGKHLKHVPCVVRFGHDRLKLLLPKDCTIAEMNLVARSRFTKRGAKINPEKSIFLFINGSLPCSSQMLSEYDTNAPDAIEVIMQPENTFG